MFDLFIPSIKVRPFGLTWMPAVPLLLTFPSEGARRRAMEKHPGSYVPINPLRAM